jgi:hypothetical protein
VARELPTDTGHYAENGQSCCNLSFHDDLLDPSGRSPGIAGKSCQQS